jgi:hypothetical protein
MDNSLDFFNGLLIKGGLCEEGWLKNRKKRKKEKAYLSAFWQV